MARRREYARVEPATEMPVLSAGWHPSVQDGGCFMEIASLLAGEEWSDHPVTADPVLGLLARAVNDQTSDTGRQGLAPMTPGVVGTGTDDARVPVQLMAVISGYALTHGAGTHARQLRKMAAAALRLSLPEPDEPGLRAWWQRHRARERALSLARPMTGCAVADLVALGGDRADVALQGLLRQAIVATRSITHPEQPDLFGTSCAGSAAETDTDSGTARVTAGSGR